MERPSQIMITLGALFLIGLLMDLLGRRTPLPRVTLLLLVGFAIGPSGLHLLPDVQEQWFPVVTTMALSMVGFLLGHSLTIPSLRKRGYLVMGISMGAVVSTAMLVFFGLLLFGAPSTIALLLAGIATATSPAATFDVIRETRTRGEFSQVLKNVVAIDDAWGLLVFSVFLAIAQMLAGQTHSWDLLMKGMWEIIGALVLGFTLGIPMAYMTGRLEPGEPTQAEALGLVLVCGGLALWLEVSFILAAMALGSTVANLATHHRRPFSAIEGIEWPFMILFFILAGASLDIQSLADTSLLGFGFILFRILGKVLGAWAGGLLGGAPSSLRNWIGMALCPQAGVALGMALLASQYLPELKTIILPVTIGTTVLFEIIGPIITRFAILQATMKSNRP